jgi:hypothetical protein
MDETELDRLIAQLWGREPEVVYAIVDGARDPRVHPAVVGSGLAYQCLFAGALVPELAAAAPYLVRLDPLAEFTRTLLRLGWGKSFGIFLASQASIEALRVHFRRFLRVQGPGRKTMFFRYYDPRVLRSYLPTCNDVEIEVIFGPVARYLVEAAAPEQILEYRRVGTELRLAVLHRGGAGIEGGYLPH